jgi:hypothetical protein
MRAHCGALFLTDVVISHTAATNPGLGAVDATPDDFNSVKLRDFGACSNLHWNDHAPSFSPEPFNTIVQCAVIYSAFWHETQFGPAIS